MERYDYRILFPARLKQIRFDLNLTQQDVADTLDVSVRTVQLWESGKVFPSVKNYRKFNMFFD